MNFPKPYHVIEENSEVRVLQLHQHVTQVGWRQKHSNICHFEVNLHPGHLKSQTWAQNEAE